MPPCPERRATARAKQVAPKGGAATLRMHLNVMAVQSLRRLYNGRALFSINSGLAAVDTVFTVASAIMAEEQLKLFHTRSALQQRFDQAFFRSLPACAGV